MGVSESVINANAFPVQNIPKMTKPLDEEVKIDCGDAQKPWHFLISVKKPLVKEQGERALLYIHGNAENIYSVDEFLQQVANTLKIPVFTYDIPGYGNVPGQPSEDSLILCAQKTLYYIKRRGFETKNISIWARSLGSVAGVRIAGCNNVRNLFLEAPLASANDALKIPIPFKIPKFNTIEYISDVRCAITIVCGSRDETLQVKNNGLKLYKEKIKQLSEETRDPVPDISFKSLQTLDGKVQAHEFRNVRIYIIDGGHHNDLNAFFSQELLKLAEVSIL